jgi:ribulose 1,5-bisphosphate synthetase/thiazole synthase
MVTRPVTRADDLAMPPVDIGTVVIIRATGHRADVLSITDHGGPMQRPIYRARQRRGGRVRVLFRDEFVIDWAIR